MSMLTMRQAMQRHHNSLVRCVAILFMTAGVAVAQTATHVPTATWDLSNIDNPRVDKWVQ